MSSPPATESRAAFLLGAALFLFSGVWVRPERTEVGYCRVVITDARQGLSPVAIPPFARSNRVMYVFFRVLRFGVFATRLSTVVSGQDCSPACCTPIPTLTCKASVSQARRPSDGGGLSQGTCASLSTRGRRGHPGLMGPRALSLASARGLCPVSGRVWTESLGNFGT